MSLSLRLVGRRATAVSSCRASRLSASSFLLVVRVVRVVVRVVVGVLPRCRQPLPPLLQLPFLLMLPVHVFFERPAYTPTHGQPPQPALALPRGRPARLLASPLTSSAVPADPCFDLLSRHPVRANDSFVWSMRRHLVRARVHASHQPCRPVAPTGTFVELQIARHSPAPRARDRLPVQHCAKNRGSMRTRLL